MKEVVIRKDGEWYCIFPQYDEEEQRKKTVHTHCKNPITAVKHVMDYLHVEDS